MRYYYTYTYSVCICHKWLTVHLCMAKWGFRCQSRNFWLKTSPGSSSNSHAEKYSVQTSLEKVTAVCRSQMSS